VLKDDELGRTCSLLRRYDKWICYRILFREPEGKKLGLEGRIEDMDCIHPVQDRGQ
jgi:hypothetical protein